MSNIANTYLVISHLRNAETKVSVPLNSEEEAIAEAKYQIEKGYRALTTQVVIVGPQFKSTEIISYKAEEKTL